MGRHRLEGFLCYFRYTVSQRVYRSGLGLLAIALATLMVPFQNCSQPYEMDVVPYEEDLESLGDVILLNHGSEYSVSATVSVSLNKPYAQEVYLTTDSSCDSGGAWAPYSQLTSYNFTPSDGERRLYVKFRNAKMEESDCFSDSIIVDATAPEVAILQSESTPSPSPLQEAKIQFTATDSTSGIHHLRCRLVEAAPRSRVLMEKEHCDPPFHVQGLALNAQYQLEVTAKDLAGNFSTKATYSWSTVDVSGTIIQMSQKPPSYSSSSTADFKFQSSDSNNQLSGYQCSLDGGAYESCSPNGTQLSNLVEGSHRIDVKAVDVVGTEVSGSYEWVVDLSVPEVQNVQLNSYNPSHCCASQSDRVGVTWEMRDAGPAGLDLKQVKCLLKESHSTYPTRLEVSDCGQYVADAGNGYVSYQADVPVQNELVAYRIQVIAVDRAGNSIPVFNGGSTLPPSMPQGNEGHFVRDNTRPFFGISSTTNNASYVDSNGQLLKPVCERLSFVENSVTRNVVEIWARDQYSTRYLFYDYLDSNGSWQPNYHFCRFKSPHNTYADYNCGSFVIPSGGGTGTAVFRIRDQAGNALKITCGYDDQSAYLISSEAL